MLSTELENAVKVWPLISNIVSVPRTADEYERTVARLDELIDEVGEAENHPLASLMETLGTLIEAYEGKYVPEPVGDPITSLAALMDEHGLRESDLPEIGSENVVSEILNGKRELTVLQIQALSNRFHVSPEVFL